MAIGVSPCIEAAIGETQQSAVVAGEGQGVENLRAFLARFEEFKQQQIQALKPVQDLITRFAAGRDGLIKQEREWEATIAPRFNLFQTLRIERRETKLHSRFLAELLDPQGCHVQRDYFLKLFLTKIPDLHRPALPTEPSDWEVRTEEDVKQYGRLDIVLRCRAQRFITVIENKVDADEGLEQITRYADWLEEQQGAFPLQNLIFLTPDGRVPATIQPERCVRVSYHENIREWLTCALESIRATPVCSALEQYLRVVEYL